jgi:signal transduction histidine kinase
MLRSLRNRLIFSHALPLLIILPLMGIALVYTLETRYLIPNITRNLEQDAILIADIARDHPEIWSNSALARDLLGRVSPGRTERIMLVTLDGVMLGSTDPSDFSRLDQLVDIPGIREVLRGNIFAYSSYAQGSQGEVIDVIAPVFGENGSVTGIVRLTYHYETFYEEIGPLRSFIGVILIISLLVGVLLGSILALNIGTPIQQVTQAVDDLASGKRTDLLSEIGPTEIRQLQHAANHLVDRLRSMEESRRTLLANLVHELGRPLGAMRAAIQALRRGAKEDPKLLDEMLLGMEYEADLMQRVTEDLSHLHDQVLGQLELDYQAISLSEWLPLIMTPWQASAHEKRLRWESEIPKDLPSLKVDPDRLAQALGNLAGNAIKFTPTGGIISVSAGVQDGEVWIRIEDTGPGIPSDEQEKVFTPFYRGKQGKRFPQGMGLGLGIARDMVVAHGGRIVMDSAPGFGSRFTIWLPSSPQNPTNLIST